MRKFLRLESRPSCSSESFCDTAQKFAPEVLVRSVHPGKSLIIEEVTHDRCKSMISRDDYGRTATSPGSTVRTLSACPSAWTGRLRRGLPRRTYSSEYV